MHPRTPDQILTEIGQARHQLERGSDALYEAELAAERAEDAAQLAFDKVLMQADGSIPEKQAQARAASVEERDAGFVARATYNRVRAKIRALETSLMTLQAELKWAREAGA
ncbi:MAG: hypothetical protein ACTIJ6_05475 [Leucobacter sp.]